MTLSACVWYTESAMKIKKNPGADSTAAAMTRYGTGQQPAKPAKRVGKISTGIALVALLAGLAFSGVAAFLVYQNWAWMAQF